MDAEQDEPIFEIELAEDLASIDNEFEELPSDYEVDPHLSNFVSNLEREHANSSHNNEVLGGVPVADNKTAHPPTKKNSKKKREFEKADQNKQDQYADDSVKDTTHKQTIWAVKIFKGNFFCHFKTHQLKIHVHVSATEGNLFNFSELNNANLNFRMANR